MTAIAPHMSSWLRQRLPVEQGASPHTCDAYATTFQLLFGFASKRLRVTPSEMTFEQLDAPLVLAFLDHIQQERGCGGRTRNARLAAIKAFMRFMEYREPASLEQIRCVLAIPSQRVTTKPIKHLEPAEVQAILDAPDPTSREGIRDRTMLHVAVTSGMRVSELVGLRRDEVTFRERYIDLYVRGKGRKDRVLTLWKAVADSVRSWLSVRGDASVPELFLNGRNDAITRSGVEYILDKHVATDAKQCPSLSGKRVSPHVLRHTCAMTTLRATRDIRKVALWLGHSSTQTTEMYLSQDPIDKLETLEAVIPPALRPGTFSPPDKLIALLKKR